MMGSLPLDAERRGEGVGGIGEVAVFFLLRVLLAGAPSAAATIRATYLRRPAEGKQKRKASVDAPESV